MLSTIISIIILVIIIYVVYSLIKKHKNKTKGSGLMYGELTVGEFKSIYSKVMNRNPSGLSAQVASEVYQYLTQNYASVMANDDNSLFYTCNKDSYVDTMFDRLNEYMIMEGMY